MKENEQRVTWVKVNPGSPGDTECYQTTACYIALGVTIYLGFLGSLALSMARDPEQKTTAYHVLKAAKASGDIAKSICNC